MVKKSIIVLLALFLVAGAALGVSAALAQEIDEVSTPPVPGYGPGRMWQQDGEQTYGPGHMWQGQEDGERPYGPGHMWQWPQEDGAPAYGPGSGPMGGWMMDGNTLPEVAADLLGLTVEEAYAELAEGISLAQLAENHGADAQAIVDAFVAAHGAALQEAVDAGLLTQEQADWMQENMAATITARVDAPWGAGFGPGAGRGFGPGSCHGFDGAPGSGAGFGGPRGRGMRGGGDWGQGWQQPAAPQQGPTG